MPSPVKVVRPSAWCYAMVTLMSSSLIISGAIEVNPLLAQCEDALVMSHLTDAALKVRYQSQYI